MRQSNASPPSENMITVPRNPLLQSALDITLDALCCVDYIVLGVFDLFCWGLRFL